MEYLIYGLADYVANVKYEDLTDRAKEVAKQAILDSYGNMVVLPMADTTRKMSSSLCWATIFLRLRTASASFTDAPPNL